MHTLFLLRSVGSLALLLLAAGCQQSPEAASGTNRNSGGSQFQDPVSVRVATTFGAVDCLPEKPQSQGDTSTDTPVHQAISLPAGTVLAVPAGRARVATIEGSSWSTKDFIEVIAPTDSHNASEPTGVLGDAASTCWVNTKLLDARLTASTTTMLMPLDAIRNFTPDSDPRCSLRTGDVISFEYLMGKNGKPSGDEPLILQDGRSIIVKISGIEDADGNETTEAKCISLLGKDALIHVGQFRERTWFTKSPFVRQ